MDERVTLGDRPQDFGVLNIDIDFECRQHSVDCIDAELLGRFVHQLAICHLYPKDTQKHAGGTERILLRYLRQDRPHQVLNSC